MFYGGMMDGALWQERKLSLVHLFAGGFEISVLLLLFLVTVWIGALRRFRSIHTLRRRLARGEPVDYDTPFPPRRGLTVREWNGLATVLLLASLVWLNCIDRQPFPGAAEPVPAPLLTHLEGEGMQYGSISAQESRAERKTTLLSELFCEAWQADTELSGWLDSTYIRVRIPQTAEPVFTVLTDSGRGGTDTAIFGEAVEIPAADSRFDALACVERQRVFADGSKSGRLFTVTVWRGKQVIRARYSGTQPLSRLLDELDNTMQRFEEGQG